MHSFARLFQAIDETNRTSGKVAAMAAYFRTAPAADAAWALYFLTGRRPKSLVKRAMIRQAALELSGLPDWLFEECREATGDGSEVIARIIPAGPGLPEDASFSEWIELHVLGLSGLDDPSQSALLKESWMMLNPDERFVYNKLITGAWRVGVSKELVLRAAAQAREIDVPKMAHQLMGPWEPTEAFWEGLAESITVPSQPYPFCLAHPVDDPPSLGDPAEWFFEWKWDGIRAQLIHREGEAWLWSRGEELLNESFPDVVALGDLLPDGTVLDGEIMAWRDGPLSFNELQKRLGRKAPSKKILSEVPATLVSFDIIEWEGRDLRELPTEDRRTQLVRTLTGTPLGETINPVLPLTSWEEAAAIRAESRAHLAEGLMLKRKDAPYGTGRKKGLWWKWKIEPYSVDAVLIYAQRGSGKRASLYTDYTFGVWDNGQLVPFAKAYSGLTDEEIRKVDSYVRRATIEKFGPVRTVKPELVFEIAFEGIQSSTRHKSGIAVRFPRMARWRTDKKIEDADSLDSLRALLQIKP
jgi:DNA ligase-1